MPKMNDEPKLVNRGGAGLLKKSTNGEVGLPPLPDALFPPDSVFCEGQVVDIDSVHQDPDNAKIHTDRNMHGIKGSFLLHGQRRPLVVREENMRIACGNGSWRAMKELGWTQCAIDLQSMTDLQFAGFAVDDNRSSENALWNFEMVARVERLRQTSGQPMPGWSADEILAARKLLDADKPTVEVPKLSLADQFLVPPFSVLDARQGYWQDRKRMWIGLGIKSELGRGNNNLGMTHTFTTENRNFYTQKTKLEEELGRTLTTVEAGMILKGRGELVDPRDDNKRRLGKAFNIGMNANKDNDWSIGDDLGSGTSIFDPVLCELVYRWFSPKGGSILDPFAGGSVRGIVAAKLGRAYTGVDLSGVQLEANRVQAETIVPEYKPTWVEGDSLDISKLVKGYYDLVFSCPPYADLERYSDDPRDISTMGYGDFIEVLQKIVKSCVTMLKPNRFACFCVGDIRAKDGTYWNFVGDTIECFRSAGMFLYNDAVLVTSVGSLPIRVGKQFVSGRKLGKTHQNVLVFVKGSWEEAVKACGTIEVPTHMFTEEK